MLLRFTFISFIIITLSKPVSAQHSDTWKAYWNNDTTLVGFKNQAGKIVIQPKFSGLIAAEYFDDIMAVSEENQGNYEHYYLTKAGRIIGRDSIYMFDNGADCECEGFIRFRDKKTDKAGMLNKPGDIVIPAEYNDLSKLRNGMVVALKDAKKEMLEGGEHYTYTGGRVMLIDSANRVIMDSIEVSDEINFYSLEISAKPNSNPIRRNYKVSDGRYYSFIDFEKEFRAWLKKSLLSGLTKQNLLNVSYTEISYWNDSKGWVTENKSSFLERNFTLIKLKLQQLRSKDAEYDIVGDGLNPFIFSAAPYRKYFNNCNESKDWIYPVKTIVINDPAMHDLAQDQFEFLRTDEGYKLISVSIGNGGLH